MTTLGGLHAAILADPASDTPRLVYADCLEERGGPGDAEYAEFIRVQCDLHRMDESGYGLWDEAGHTCFLDPCRHCVEHERYLAVADRQTELFRLLVSDGRLGPELCPAFGEFLHAIVPADGRPSGLVRRGFVAEVRCTLARWLGVGPALVMRHPIERVELTGHAPLRTALNRWTWWTAGSSADEEPDSDLPPEIYVKLPEHVNDNTPEFGGWRVYPTEITARDACSMALLDYARNPNLVPESVTS